MCIVLLQYLREVLWVDRFGGTNTNQWSSIEWNGSSDHILVEVNTLKSIRNILLSVSLVEARSLACLHVCRLDMHATDI